MGHFFRSMSAITSRKGGGVGRKPRDLQHLLPEQTGVMEQFSLARAEPTHQGASASLSGNWWAPGQGKSPLLRVVPVVSYPTAGVRTGRHSAHRKCQQSHCLQKQSSLAHTKEPPEWPSSTWSQNSLPLSREGSRRRRAGDDCT